MKHDYQTLINKGIKRLRDSLNLTQERFSEKANISVEGLKNLERNKYQPQAKTIDNICRAFNITPFELIIPDAEQDTEIIKSINMKLKLCSKKELIKINELIDIIRK